MAFSYSDENFTVVGNLCFVHIILDGTKTSFDIPPAIRDRMLFNTVMCTYSIFTKNRGSGGGTACRMIGYAVISSDEIICSDAGVGYLSFYFPIDSNK